MSLVVVVVVRVIDEGDGDADEANHLTRVRFYLHTVFFHTCPNKTRHSVKVSPFTRMSKSKLFADEAKACIVMRVSGLIGAFSVCLKAGSRVFIDVPNALNVVIVFLHVILEIVVIIDGINVESDRLNRDGIGAVFKNLRESLTSMFTEGGGGPGAFREKKAVSVEFTTLFTSFEDHSILITLKREPSSNILDSGIGEVIGRRNVDFEGIESGDIEFGLSHVYGLIR